MVTMMVHALVRYTDHRADPVAPNLPVPEMLLAHRYFLCHSGAVEEPFTFFCDVSTSVDMTERQRRVLHTRASRRKGGAADQPRIA